MVGNPDTRLRAGCPRKLQGSTYLLSPNYVLRYLEGAGTHKEAEPIIGLLRNFQFSPEQQHIILP